QALHGGDPPRARVARSEGPGLGGDGRGFRPTYVRVGKPVKLPAGDQALEVTIRFGTKAGEIRALLTFVRVDRVQHAARWRSSAERPRDLRGNLDGAAARPRGALAREHDPSHGVGR